MTPSEIAAYVGAAAWAPQLAQWAYAALKKPKVQLVSAGTAQIGYMGLGPIVILTTAISSDRRDALIRGASLRITHEKGDDRQLKWTWLKESPFQMSGPSGETLDVAKNQPALALKVTTQALVEKLITFSDPDFPAIMDPANQAMFRQYEYLKTIQGDPTDALLKSKEFLEAQELFKKTLYWKQGSYRLEVSLNVVGLRSPHKAAFKLHLGRAEADLLQSNFQIYESQVRSQLRVHDGQPAQWPQWKWVFPLVAEAK